MQVTKLGENPLPPDPIKPQSKRKIKKSQLFKRRPTDFTDVQALIDKQIADAYAQGSIC